MAGTLWFYVKDDKRLGPVDFEQLVGLLLGGQLPQTALVWHQGLREWMSADRIPEIAEQLPPPLPPGKSPRATLIMERPPMLSARSVAADAPGAPAAPAVNPRIEDLRRRLEKDPASRLFAQLAEELRKEGELEESIRICRDGLQKHPLYPSARMTLGRALLDSGDLGAARTEFEAVLQGAPDNLLARRFLEECQTRLADPEGTSAERPSEVSAAAPVAFAASAPQPAEAAEEDSRQPGRSVSPEELPPIPLVAAEEHWELAAPYEVPRHSASLEGAPEAPPQPASEALPEPPAPPPPPAENPAPAFVPVFADMPRLPPEPPAPPRPKPKKRGPIGVPDLSTMLSDSPALNVPDAAPLPAGPPPVVPPAPGPPAAFPAVAPPARPASPAAGAAPAGTAPAPSVAAEELPSTGSLAEYDFPDLIHALSVQRWTGTVDLHRGRIDTTVQVNGGRLVFASSTNKDERLGELLLRRERITLQQYYEASKAIRKGKRLGTILVEQGALEPKELVKVVVDHTREVIYSVFQWTEGFYQLKEGPSRDAESITLKLSTADIIMEGIGRIQAWGRIERGVGGPRAHYIRADDYQERLKEMTLTPEKLLIVGDLGGERDVASICQASKLGDFEVCRTLWAFRVIGILRRVDGGPPAPDA